MNKGIGWFVITVVFLIILGTTVVVFGFMKAFLVWLVSFGIAIILAAAISLIDD